MSEDLPSPGQPLFLLSLATVFGAWNLYTELISHHQLLFGRRKIHSWHVTPKKSTHSFSACNYTRKFCEEPIGPNRWHFSDGTLLLMNGWITASKLLWWSSTVTTRYFSSGFGYWSSRTRLVFMAVVSSWEFLDPLLIVTYAYCPTPMYFINIPCTLTRVVTIIERMILHVFLCHLHYSFERITAKIELLPSKLALRIKTRYIYNQLL